MQRFMCMNCGRFFNMEMKFDQLRNCCPACGDLYVCDNIEPGVPDISATAVSTECRMCGLAFEMEFIGDCRYCPGCKSNTFRHGHRLVEYQEAVLSGLGVYA